MNNIDYNVFICYRGDEGGVLASNIYSDLCLYTNNKLKVFFAPRCVPHGDNFKEACLDIAGKVQLVILILSKGFFDKCGEPDDIVYGELKSALANPETKFLPIIMPYFDFKEVDLSTWFDDTETDRIKHISAIKFTDVYSFSSVDMLIPILRDKVGEFSYIDAVTDSLLHAEVKKRMHISAEGKDNFFSDANKTEKNRLKAQQELLMKFDMPVYEKRLQGKEGLCVLDLGCGNGVALMNRLGNRKEVDKIIGIEYDKAATQSANEKYGDRAKFYCMDVESEDFKDELIDIMEENGIEKFDFVNLLAVMSHFKSPFKVLRTVKSCCRKGATVFIRNIDDGLNICYPDDEKKFERAFSLLAKCDTTGYRYSGRELFTLLKRAGYKNITLEKAGLSSVPMNYDERAACFDVIFKFIRQGVNRAAENHPSDVQAIADKRWFGEVYDDLEEAFLSDEFFVLFGFILYTAEA